METFIGGIYAFGFNFAPYGWALCQGQVINIASNTALFSLLGTFYGGNGTTTFGLPNLIGNGAVGQGTSPSGSTYAMGQTAGGVSVTLALNNLPSHTHPMSAQLIVNGDPAGQGTPAGNYIAASASSNDYAGTATPGQFAGGTSAIAVANAGLNQAMSIVRPYLCINYSISTQGLFPQRQ